MCAMYLFPSPSSILNKTSNGRDALRQSSKPIQNSFVKMLWCTYLTRSNIDPFFPNHGGQSNLVLFYALHSEKGGCKPCYPTTYQLLVVGCLQECIMKNRMTVIVSRDLVALVDIFLETWQLSNILKYQIEAMCHTWIPIQILKLLHQYCTNSHIIRCIVCTYLNHMAWPYSLYCKKNEASLSYCVSGTMLCKDEK